MNTVQFTVGALKRLGEFIESELVEDKKWFCDYDKQAIQDAIVYLTKEETLDHTPLFTRTASTRDELFDHINAIESLGFKHYVIGRDVEVKIPTVAGLATKQEHDRWIIKVYEEVAE